MNPTSTAATTSDFAGLASKTISPDHPGYDAARTVVYGGIDLRPRAIVRVADAVDVAKVIAHARAHQLEIAIRSGGHSIAGHSGSEGGMVIDLRDMKQIDFDPVARTVWAGAGLTAFELLQFLAPHKLVVGFGDAGTVGISGITLGGGVGYLTRKLGLTIDAVLALELVTADGQVLIADADNHPDLFWALRGGGGNFGVVTRIRFRLSELETFTGGMLMLPATAETIHAFMVAARAAPEALSSIVNIMPAPPMPFLPAEKVGQPVIMGMMAYAGPDPEAQGALAPFRSIAEPLADFVKAGEYHTTMFPPEESDFHPTVAIRNLFMDDFTFDDARRLIEYLADSDAPFRVAQLRVLGGAATRVPAETTAYAHRHRTIMANVAAFYDGSDTDRLAKQAWARRFAEALNGSDTAAYVNFLGDEGDERIRDAYPEPTWTRLRQVKSQYDPENLFRRNQNIPPA